MEFQIRPIAKSDFKQVSNFLPEMWFSHSSNSDLVSKDNLAQLNPQEYLEELSQDKNQEGFVAILDNKIAGFIRCEIKDCPDFYSFKKELYVDDLIVLEDFRKQGIATKLISECVLFAKNNNIDLLTCKIWKFNGESKSLFEKFGFQEDFSFYSYRVKK
jgi:ribosomal protein S18 acetylase RimI-like enzyme